MSDAVSFFVPCEPRGKQRHRTGRGRMYTPQKTVDAERAIAWEAKKAFGSRKPLEGAASLIVGALFAYPKSWSLKQRVKAKTSKPDIDNVVKLVKDALKGVAWKDDAQVVYLQAGKFYTTQTPGLSIVIGAYEPP